MRMRTRVKTSRRGMRTGRKETSFQLRTASSAPAGPSGQPAVRISDLPSQLPHHVSQFLAINIIIHISYWFYFLGSALIVTLDFKGYHTLLVSLLFHRLLLLASFALSSSCLTADCLEAQGSVFGSLFSISLTQ